MSGLFVDAEKELVEQYMVTCRSLKVVPDAGLLAALATKANHFKSSVGYSEGHVVALVELLLAAHDRSIRLPFRKLQFQQGTIGSNGVLLLARFLQADKNISHLSLANSHVGPRGVEALSEVLKSGQNTTLRHLDLHGNRMFHRGAVALADALSSPKHGLIHLKASNNHIGFAGVTLLEEAAVQLNKQRNAKSVKPVTLESVNPFTADTVANFVFEETWNGISHGVGFIGAVLATLLTYYRCWSLDVSETKFWAATVYCLSLMTLYACSCLYHSFFKLGLAKDIFRRLDHAAIFLVIAGSYTPVIDRKSVV